jgi:hypothetical protein
MRNLKDRIQEQEIMVAEARSRATIAFQEHEKGQREATLVGKCVLQVLENSLFLLQDLKGLTETDEAPVIPSIVVLSPGPSPASPEAALHRPAKLALLPSPRRGSMGVAGCSPISIRSPLPMPSPSGSPPATPSRASRTPPSISRRFSTSRTPNKSFKGADEEGKLSEESGGDDGSDDGDALVLARTNSVNTQSPFGNTQSPWHRVNHRTKTVTPMFESAWILNLVGVSNKSKLRNSLGPSLRRLQGACRARLSLIQDLSASLRLGQADVLLDHILPLILRCFRNNEQSHLLHSSQLPERSNEASQALLSFYKGLVVALNHQELVCAASITTPDIKFFRRDIDVLLRTQRLLHFFNVNFQKEDCDIVIGCGIFSALVSCMDSMGTALQNLEALPDTCSAADVLAFNLRDVKDLAWQTFKYLTVCTPATGTANNPCFPMQYALMTLLTPQVLSLSKPEIDPTVLALSVGRMHLRLLIQNLMVISSLPVSVPLRDSGVGLLLYQTLDILRIMTHFTSLALDPKEDIKQLLGLSARAPPVIRALCMDLLAAQLPLTDGSATPTLAQRLLLELGELLLHTPEKLLHAGDSSRNQQETSTRDEEVSARPPYFCCLAFLSSTVQPFCPLLPWLSLP